jgi:hypothetical protein
MPGRNVKFRLAGSHLWQYLEVEKRKDHRERLSNILLAIALDTRAPWGEFRSVGSRPETTLRQLERRRDPAEWFCREPALTPDDGRRAMIHPGIIEVLGCDRA